MYAYPDNLPPIETLYSTLFAEALQATPESSMKRCCILQASSAAHLLLKA